MHQAFFSPKLAQPNETRSDEAQAAHHAVIRSAPLVRKVTLHKLVPFREKEI
jgi:hypothetical protein